MVVVAFLFEARNEHCLLRRNHEKHGAPPPLQTYDWMLHQWRLTQIDAKKHAQPLGGTTTTTATALTTTTTNTKNTDTKDMKWPLIFHSHGLGGNSEMYSYQTRSLAANGYVVVVIDHSDNGSAPVVLCRMDPPLAERKCLARLDGVGGGGDKDKPPTSDPDGPWRTPTWLGRATGLTGQRNPLETAHEIHTRTIAVRERQTQ
jgi:hypothetical protein